MSKAKVHPCQKVWEGMMRRCYCERHRAYHRYGGRGIDVCNQWHDRNTFFAWLISNGWQKGLQLDRIDNNAGYYPENCRVVDVSTNANNRCNNRLVEIRGELLTVAQVSRKYGILHSTLMYRIKNLGLVGEDIIMGMMRKRQNSLNRVRGLNHGTETGEVDQHYQE